MANVLRLFIIVVIFILGVIVGNVYVPQKNFDQKNIIAPKKPKAFFNVDNTPSVDTVLKEADNYKNLLIASGQDQEEIIGFENNFKRTILQLYYKEAAANYSLELLRLQQQPEHTAPYIEARDKYKKIIELIENLYPIETPKEVLVIKEETPASPTENNTAASTETAKSTQTAPAVVPAVVLPLVIPTAVTPSTQTAQTK